MTLSIPRILGEGSAEWTRHKRGKTSVFVWCDGPLWTSTVYRKGSKWIMHREFNPGNSKCQKREYIETCRTMRAALQAGSR